MRAMLQMAKYFKNKKNIQLEVTPAQETET